MKILDKLNDFMEVSKERLEICKSCVHYVHSHNVCGNCICYMPAKVKLPHASCPYHKWEEYKYDKE